MKKRIISMVLCLIMLLSFTATSVAASDAEGISVTSIEVSDKIPNVTYGEISDEVSNSGEAKETFNEVFDNTTEIQITSDQNDSHFYNYVECPVADLATSQIKTLDSNRDYMILPDMPVKQDLDLSHAVDITSKLNESGASLADSPENQAPVANPLMFIGNPESMRDGKYTTDTKDNTGYKTFCFNQSNTWMDLHFVISYSQKVDLELYKLKEEYVEEITRDDGLVIDYSKLESLVDPSLPNYGAYEKEEFLDGNPIGYLKAIRFTGNIDGSETDAQVQYRKVSKEEWAEAIADAVIENSPAPVVTKDLYAYGYGGLSYEAWKAQQGAAAYLIPPDEAPEEMPSETLAETPSEAPAETPNEAPTKALSETPEETPTWPRYPPVRRGYWNF